jgi:hypothetical protein
MASTLRICLALALLECATAFLAPPITTNAVLTRIRRTSTLTPEASVEATSQKGEFREGSITCHEFVENAD